MPLMRSPAPAPHSSRSPRSRRIAPTPSTWIVGATTVVTLLVLAVTVGAPGGLVWAGGVGSATAIYVVVSGRQSWALLPSRKLGMIAFVASIALLVSGIYLAAQRPVASNLAGTGSDVASGLQPTTPPTRFTTPTASPTPADTAVAEPVQPQNAADAGEGTAHASEDVATSSAGPTALEVLSSLPIKGRAPKTGYDRTGMFGEAWIDVDNNGCDTRNDILARDLAAIVTSGTCRVLTGTLISPYTSEEIDFIRGNDTSALVQIDHVVALSNAWQTGAQQLSQNERESLANDPLNLLAVDGRSNSQKGDGDAATWLPSAKGIRCSYVARQISVKETYGLWITKAEHDAMVTVLSECADEPLLSSVLITVPTPLGIEATTPPTVTSPTVPDPSPSVPEVSAPGVAPGTTTFFANCDAVREAGAAPLSSGQPGYSFVLDRDRDGVACEI